MKHPEEGRRTYLRKRYEYNNKDEVNCSNIQSYKNYQSLSEKFRLIMNLLSCHYYTHEASVSVRVFLNNSPSTGCDMRSIQSEVKLV